MLGIVAGADFGNMYYITLRQPNNRVIVNIKRNTKNRPLVHYWAGISSINARNPNNISTTCIVFTILSDLRCLICYDRPIGTNLLFLIYTCPKKVRATIISPRKTNTNFKPTLCGSSIFPLLAYALNNLAKCPEQCPHVRKHDPITISAEGLRFLVNGCLDDTFSDIPP